MESSILQITKDRRESAESIKNFPLAPVKQPSFDPETQKMLRSVIQTKQYLQRVVTDMHSLTTRNPYLRPLSFQEWRKKLQHIANISENIMYVLSNSSGTLYTDQAFRSMQELHRQELENQQKTHQKLLLEKCCLESEAKKIQKKIGSLEKELSHMKQTLSDVRKERKAQKRKVKRLEKNSGKEAIISLKKDHQQSLKRLGNQLIAEKKLNEQLLWAKRSFASRLAQEVSSHGLLQERVKSQSKTIRDLQRLLQASEQAREKAESTLRYRQANPAYFASAAIPR